jgi:hypothetical protein
VIDGPRTCTLCAEFVDVVPTADGREWQAVDGAGMAYGVEPLPGMCDCPDVAPLAGVDPPRWYGHAVPLATWFGQFHMHNWDGGESFYTELVRAFGPCPWRPPARRRTARFEPTADRPPCPECCGKPMWWTPAGWTCRVSGQIFGSVLP